jgi:serine/threonine-protein kinase HipA
MAQTMVLGTCVLAWRRPPPGLGRPFNRTHQLEKLVAAAEKLEEDGRLPHEVLDWLAKLPEKNDKHNMQRIEYATLELARAAGLRVCGTRLEKVGTAEALMLQRFDREWNSDAKTYARQGLISGLTVLDAEDGYTGRDRWSYPLLADELRRWSSKPDEDRRAEAGAFRRPTTLCPYHRSRGSAETWS